MMQIQWKKNHWTKEDYQMLRQYLISIQEEAYQKFQMKLIPNAKNLLGIRMPKLYQIAKEIARGNIEEFILQSQNDFYEEIMICGLVIGECTHFTEVCLHLDKYIFRIDNWAICDSVCSHLKIFRRYPEEGFTYLLSKLKMQSEYHLRFVLVMLLCHYIKQPFIKRVLQIIEQIDTQYYYVKMAQAWLSAECIICFEKESLYLLEVLPDWTAHKTIQKLRESKKVTKDKKLFYQTYRRKET